MSHDKVYPLLIEIIDAMNQDNIKDQKLKLIDILLEKVVYCFYLG